MPRPALADCPTCHQRMLVVNSRPEDGKRYRRYHCEHCDTRATTYEITAEEYDRLQSTKVNVGAIRDAITALQIVERAVNNGHRQD